ncbi:MAG TPA: 5-deoxy-glucuronate isomerase [Bryobacteraceae bacterium]|nr:5-deoxy-glucuronate isomerase [Bryobacteraceae bacterium]
MTQLLVRPSAASRAESYGFEYLSFRTQRLAAGHWVEEETGERELGLVLLGGRCSVESSRGAWHDIGRRPHVFAGMPYALYLPLHTQFRIAALSPCDVAFCYCRAERYFPSRLVTPADVDVEIRGAGNATRQINGIFKPDFPAHRLIVVEVYTPGGNWSSFPPHKHDVHNPPAEADLEEIYYYRIDPPEGFAIQKVYTPDRRLDETITVRDGEMVLVPEGYHPVVAAHGYNAYYLNALGGSMRSLAASDDPQYEWVRQTWRERDPRVPLVSMAMEQ